MAKLALKFAPLAGAAVGQTATVQDGPNTVTIVQDVTAADGWSESAVLVEPTTFAVGGVINVSTVGYNALGEPGPATVAPLTLVNGNLPDAPAAPTAAAVELP